MSFKDKFMQASEDGGPLDKVWCVVFLLVGWGCFAFGNATLGFSNAFISFLYFRIVWMAKRHREAQP